MTTAFTKTPHTTAWIPVSKLDVRWVNAQRGFNEKYARHLADTFDPDLFSTLAVSEPNGKQTHHVIDGQHRVWAVRELWGEDEKVPCNILPAKDAKRAAQLFDKLNTALAVKPIDRFCVRVTGEHETEVAVNKIITALGYKASGSMQEGSLRAVRSCMTVYRRYGGDRLRDVLQMIQEIWGKDPHAVEGIMIQGFAHFMNEHPDANKRRLREQVRKAAEHTPGLLLWRARSLKEVFGGSTAVNLSRALVAIYNSGLHSSGRLETPAA